MGLKMLAEKVEEKIMKWYEKKGVEYTSWDYVLTRFWTRVCPRIILIPIIFWVFKLVLINFMLTRYGFEKTILYVAIILILRPMFSEMLKSFGELKWGLGGGKL